MAADESAHDAPTVEPDEALSAGDAEAGAPPDHDADEAPDTAEPTILDTLRGAHANIGAMVEAIEDGNTEAEDMDGLLLSARSALSAVDASPQCPMCQGAGSLAEEPPADPRAERCQDCHGRGTVYTGSLVPESAVRPCGTCGGKGFNDKATVHPITPPPVDYTMPPTTAQFYNPADPSTWHLPPPPGFAIPAQP